VSSAATARPELVRTIGRWSLVALMVNSIVGAGIFGLPSLLAARLGGYSPIAALIAGAGMLVVASCLAEVSSRFAGTGGLYLYGRAAFGRFAGLLIAWLTWLMRVTANAASADLFANYLAQFIPFLRGKRWELLVVAVLVGHLATLNYIGVKTGKTVSNIFTVLKLGFLVFFIGAGLLAIAFHSGLRVPLQFGTMTSHGSFEAMLLLVYGYGGFEGAVTVGGEASNPKRDMPFALLTALVVQCFLYTGVIFVVLETLPDAGGSMRPLADAARNFLGGRGAWAIGFGALISTYGLISANLLHGPRLPFALAEQGDFPKIFAKIHAKFRTPHVSIIVHGSLILALAAAGNFRWNAVLSALARLVVYVAMAVALLVLRRNWGAAPFTLPLGAVCSGCTILMALILLSQMGLGEAVALGLTALVALVNWAMLGAQTTEAA
jgi:amino acid transporter